MIRRKDHIIGRIDTGAYIYDDVQTMCHRFIVSLMRHDSEDTENILLKKLKTLTRDMDKDD